MGRVKVPCSKCGGTVRTKNAQCVPCTAEYQKEYWRKEHARREEERKHAQAEADRLALIEARRKDMRGALKAINPGSFTKPGYAVEVLTLTRQITHIRGQPYLSSGPATPAALIEAANRTLKSYGLPLIELRRV